MVSRVKETYRANTTSLKKLCVYLFSWFNAFLSSLQTTPLTLRQPDLLINKPETNQPTKPNIQGQNPKALAQTEGPPPFLRKKSPLLFLFTFYSGATWRTQELSSTSCLCPIPLNNKGKPPKQFIILNLHKDDTTCEWYF